MSKSHEFETKVIDYIPRSRIVTLEGGWKVKLPDSVTDDPQAGQQVTISVAQADVKELGSRRPPTAQRFVLAKGSVSSTASPRTNTRDDR